MFEALLWTAAGISVLGWLSAMDGSRDVFHPLIFIMPMMAFLYAWMPSQLLASDGLARFFDGDQLIDVQRLFVLGILAFAAGCLAAGLRVPRYSRSQRLSAESCRRLLAGSYALGTVGMACWLITIVNVGGFVNAFNRSYAGGWDDSGYIRDGSMLLLVAVLLSVTTLAAGGPRQRSVLSIVIFGSPWTIQALLMGRRGPTFAIVTVVVMGWYFARDKRPPLVAAAAAGIAVGWLVLFLVTNRSSIYLGSDFDVSTDVTRIVRDSDAGNEYIYGAGSVVSAERRDHYFWMRRYLAQVLIRPIPSSIWPTKYEDFGVPELLENAGTGEGFADALGWNGAPGSAPGIVADLWVELWWLAVPAMAALGWTYGWLWKKAVTKGGPWCCQYIILSALSMYLVMQTMEAVIFRTLELSIPCWIVWKWAQRAPQEEEDDQFDSDDGGMLSARSVQRA